MEGRSEYTTPNQEPGAQNYTENPVPSMAQGPMEHQWHPRFDEQYSQQAFMPMPMPMPAHPAAISFQVIHYHLLITTWVTFTLLAQFPYHPPWVIRFTQFTQSIYSISLVILILIIQPVPISQHTPPQTMTTTVSHLSIPGMQVMSDVYEG